MPEDTSESTSLAEGETIAVTSGVSATGRSIPVRTYDPEFLIRPFLVTVEGFGAFIFHATSRGKALSDAWNSYNGAQDPLSFGEFMKIAKATRDEPADRFGEPILVGGRRAFYVSWDSHYVQFALPGQTNYGNSHPLDVTTVTGEPFRR